MYSRKNTYQGAGNSSVPRNNGYSSNSSNSSNYRSHNQSQNQSYSKFQNKSHNSSLKSDVGKYNSNTNNSTSFRSTTGQPSKANQVRSWASSKLPLTDMISSYEERTGNNSFESMVYEIQQKYFEHIVTYLSKFRRPDVLEWYFDVKIPQLKEKFLARRDQSIFQFIGSVESEDHGETTSSVSTSSVSRVNIKDFTFKPKSTSIAYSPINHAIWSDKYDISEEKINKMKDTVRILVKNGFDLEVGKIIDNNGVQTIEYENPIKAIIDSKNCLPEHIRDNLYDFIMYEIDNRKFWMNRFKTLAGGNAIVNDRIRDMVYMFGIHNTVDVVEDRFRCFITPRSIPVKKDFITSNFELRCFNIWLESTQPIPNSIFNRYYQDPRNNIAENPRRIARLILESGEDIIQDYIQKLDADEDFENRTSVAYKGFVLLLGILYSKGFYQTEIINKLKSMLALKPHIIYDCIIHFFFGGNINLNEMCLELREIVSSIVSGLINTKYYTFFNINIMSYIQLCVNKKIHSLPTLYSNLVDPRIECKYTEKMIEEGSRHYSNWNDETEDIAGAGSSSKAVKTVHTQQSKQSKLTKSAPIVPVQKSKSVFTKNKFQFLEEDDEDNEGSEVQTNVSNHAEICTYTSVDEIEEDTDLITTAKSITSGSPIDDIMYSLELKNKQEVSHELGLAIISTLMERSSTSHIQHMKNFVSYIDSTSEVKLLNILRNFSSNPHVKNYFVDNYDVPSKTYDDIVSKLF